VSPVRYELGFISQKTTFFIVTAVKTSNLTWFSGYLEFRMLEIVHRSSHSDGDLKGTARSQSRAVRLPVY
jgi:hypothetical protein